MDFPDTRSVDPRLRPVRCSAPAWSVTRLSGKESRNVPLFRQKLATKPCIYLSRHPKLNDERGLNGLRRFGLLASNRPAKLTATIGRHGRQETGHRGRHYCFPGALLAGPDDSILQVNNGGGFAATNRQKLLFQPFRWSLANFARHGTNASFA